MGVRLDGNGWRGAGLVIRVVPREPRSAQNGFVSDAAARDRLRRAQRREADALRGYGLAMRQVAVEVSRRDAAVAVHEASIGHARERADRALAALVEASGVDRAAVLVDQPISVVRAVVKRDRRPDRMANGDAPTSL